MTDYIIKLSTEQLSGSITYVNSPDPPSSPTLEVEDFWRIRLNGLELEVGKKLTKLIIEQKQKDLSRNTI